MATSIYRRPVYRNGFQPSHALPEYANVAAAITAGLRIGDLWVNSSTGVVSQIMLAQFPTTTTTTTT